MNYYTVYTAGETVKMTEEEAALLLEMLESENLDEPGDELCHGMTLDYDAGFGYLFSGDDENSNIDDLPESFLNEFGRLIGLDEELPYNYVEIGFAHTASRLRVGSHGGGSMRIHSDGSIEYPTITWKTANKSEL